MESIIITPNLNIGYKDLGRFVDYEYFFTLRDILRATMYSREIPLNLMQKIVNCDCFPEFWDECQSHPFQPDDLDYLGLTWIGEKVTTSENNYWCNNYWDFFGFSKTKNENRSVEMLPIWKISDLPILISDYFEIHNFDNEEDVDIKVVKFKPSMMLVELLQTIFWYLSIFGSPVNREELINGMIASLKKIYSEDKQKTELVTAIKEGGKK